jgi:hypothetical protein
MSSNTVSSRKAVIAIGALVILAVIVVPRFMPVAPYEGQGRITSIDPAERTISVEVVDPTNGVTRELSGIVPADCAITINGAPAAFADLRVDDIIQGRARIEQADRGPDGERKQRLAAERIDVTRSEGGAPWRKLP